MPRIQIHTDGNPNTGQIYDGVPYTVITDSFLDEELDVCPIEVKDTWEKKPFPRFSVATLVLSETDKRRYLVASDDVVENIGNGKSDHLVQLIEPTKLLERFMVGNKAVTQPIKNEYTSIKVSADQYDPNIRFTNFLGSLELTNGLAYQSPIFPEPADGGTVSVPIYSAIAFDGYDNMRNGNIVRYSCEVFVNNIKTQAFYYRYPYYTENEKGEIIQINDPSSDVLRSIDVPVNSMVDIKYYIAYGGSGVAVHGIKGSNYSFCVLTKEEPKIITLRDAANSMICAAGTYKYGDGDVKARFSLDDHTAAELEKITSPEITVTNATLREALDEVAKVVSSITRLDVIPNGDTFDFKIVFEKYCKDKDADLSGLGEPCEIRRKVSCEDYCTALDATVENLVQYDANGSIWDPCGDLFRTPRSEDASYRVTEETAEIMTAFPIERLDNVTCRLYSSDTAEDIDITPYIFEASEYGALSSYKSAYPYSKAYALCYTIGQKNITGLNFAVPNPIHDIFSKPAIVNIINKAGGKEFNNTTNLLDFSSLLFKVKYVPTGSARVLMRKPDSFGKMESVLPYNQSAAKLDADAFGRSMFGAVLRMGNEQSMYTYITDPDVGENVPEKGERFGEDGYIAEIREEFSSEQKKVTLTVVEGFNRLSQFVGVNKAQRLFEISERMSLDRHIVFEDKCLISTKKHEDLTGSVIVNNQTVSFFQYILDASEGGCEKKFNPFMITKGYDENGNGLEPCFLPCVVYGMGNALTFTASFADNYSAGRRIDGSRRTTVEDGTEYYQTETDVRYTDLFGRIKSLEFNILPGIIEDHLQNMVQADFIDSANTVPSLPEILCRDVDNDGNPDVPAPIVAATGQDRIYIDKDSREAIKTLTYQISFLGDNDIKISPYIAENFPFIKGKQSHLVWVPLYSKINNMTEWVDAETGDYTASKTTTCSDEAGIKYVCMECKLEWTSKPVKGWAVVNFSEINPNDSKKRRFLFGKNEPISVGESVSIYMTFYH